jgi:hypothetical protein
MENKLTIVEALNEIMKAVGGIAKKAAIKPKDLISVELIQLLMRYLQPYKSSA